MQLEGFEDVSELLRAGVYALCKRGVVVYVGKSKSLYSRIYTHRNLANRSAKGQKVPSWFPASLKGIVFDQVFIRPCTLDEIDALEAEMINLYKPKFNESIKNHDKIRSPVALTINGRTVVLNPGLPKVEGGLSRRVFA